MFIHFNNDSCYNYAIYYKCKINFTSFSYSFNKYCSYILCFKVNTKIFSQDVKSLSDLSSLTEEALTGNLVVQAFNKQEDIITSIDESIEKQYVAAKTLEFTIFQYTLLSDL